MKKKTIVIIALSVICFCLLSGIVFVRISYAGDATTHDLDSTDVSAVTSESIGLDLSGADNDFTYIPPIPVAPGIDTVIEDLSHPPQSEEVEEAFVPDFTMDLEPSSLTVFVNKEYALPKNYKPTDLVVPNVIFNLNYYDERTLMRPEAAKALEKLFAAAQKDGIILYGVSAYRSYDRQHKIFTDNIATKGKAHTLRYSAVPGTSEHQTGLSIDVSSKSLDFKLSANFASSPEGIWLAENAHLYGYIIRYPEGKGNVTGYAYEPWHIRYLGKGFATYLYENELTLEEYYNYTPSPDFNFEALYADIINYVAPTVTATPVVSGGVIIGANGEIIDNGIGEDGQVIGEDGQVIDGEVPTEEPGNLTPVPTEEVPQDETDTDTSNPLSPTPAPTPTPTPSPTPTPTIPADSNITPTPINPSPSGTITSNSGI